MVIRNLIGRAKERVESGYELRGDVPQRNVRKIVGFSEILCQSVAYQRIFIIGTFARFVTDELSIIAQEVVVKIE